MSPAGMLPSRTGLSGNIERWDWSHSCKEEDVGQKSWLANAGAR